MTMRTRTLVTKAAARWYATAFAAIRGRRPNWRRFFECLHVAAALGSLDAVQDLGQWYLEGMRIDGHVVLKRDIGLGALLIRSAAEAGHVGAFFPLASCYKGGVGITQSSRLAQTWYVRAFRAGSGTAAYNLAIEAFRRGRKRAYVLWLRRAAELGDPDAGEELDRYVEASASGKTTKALKA